MRLSILVIDDFYDDADVVRERALKLEYPKPPQQQNYPGRNSVQRFLPNDLDEVVSRLVHEPVVGTGNPTHGHFRLSLDGDDAERRYYVHVDGDALWSGILYLTLPEHCQGGTEFYRHREYGSDRTFIFDKEAQQHGWSTCSRFAIETIQRDGNDRSKWEHLMTIPMRFNRMILFRPWFWHTAGESFGDSPESGRLVQLFFFGSKKTT